MQLTAILDALQWAIPAFEKFPAAFRAFSQASAPMVVTALWQGVVVASGLAICLRVAPRISAAHRFSLWTACFVTLVCLPFGPSIAHLTSAASSSVSSSLVEDPIKPWLQLDIRWSLAIAALWAAASIFRAVDLAVHSFRLLQLWMSAIPAEPDGRLSFSLAALTGMRGRKPAQLCTTQHLDRPSVIGFFAPRILIPEWLFNRLSPAEFDQVVLHEAEHLRRSDDWTNLFQKLCLVLFPLNPALWWIERRLCQEREMACDDGVVKATRAPRAYAACLASLAERGLQRRAEALSLGAWQRRSELVHRVHSILTRKRALNPVATRVLLGTLGCTLVLASVELAHCPQLIAFVSAPKHEAAQPGASPRLQPKPARLLNASYVPDQRSAFAHTAREILATRIKSALPQGRSSTPVSGQPSVQRTDSKPPDAMRFEATQFQLAPGSPHQEFLKAELPDSKPNTTPLQQWFLVAAWEEVETSNGHGNQVADYDVNQGADPAATESTSPPNNPATNHITVTRLIFRVIPVGSISAQPSSIQVRSGWFVIQL